MRGNMLTGATLVIIRAHGRHHIGLMFMMGRKSTTIVGESLVSIKPDYVRDGLMAAAAKMNPDEDSASLLELLFRPQE